MKRFSFFVALCVAVSFGWGTSAFAQHRTGDKNQNNQKIGRDLQESLKSGADTQRVIISVKAGYRASVRRALESHGDAIQSEHESINALSGVVHSSDIAELARQPWIDSIAADSVMFAIGSKGADVDTRASSSKGAPASGSNGPATNLYLRQTLGLSAVAAPGTPSGQGIVVAVLDSGLAPSKDLPLSRMVGFYDFTRPNCLKKPTACAVAPFDPFGHGTHVAGLIGSGGALSGGLYQGVAPRVTFLGVRVLDENGQGFASDLISALEFVTKNRTLLGVRVVNLSLGTHISMPAILDPIVRAVEQASAAGIVVVVASGNNPKGSENTYGGITTPANAPSALTTGATDTQLTTSRGDDVVADYSARGPTWFDGFAKPDFVSPGTNLISNIDPSASLNQLLPKNHISVNGNAFLRLTGTSMGAGVASGVVALVLEAQRDALPGTPPLTPNAVKAILEYTAIPVSKGKPDVLTQGAGQINAAGAVSLASKINTSTALGGWWLTNGVSGTTAIGTQTYAWGQNILWGTRVLGGDLVYRNLLIWSRNIIWGTNILWGTTTEGDSILWGTLRNIRLSGRHDLSFALRIVGGAPTLYVSGDRAKANSILWGTFAGPIVKASNIIWGTVAIWARRLTEGRVLGLQDGDSILWGTNNGLGENILWGTDRDSADSILWGTWDGDSILWGTWDGNNILWGTWADGDSILWGTTVISSDGDHIIWGTFDADTGNILWGTGENILWGTGENIIWGTGENILWGTGENIIWGTENNIVWGTDSNVWGTFRSGGAF